EAGEEGGVAEVEIGGARASRLDGGDALAIDGHEAAGERRAGRGGDEASGESYRSHDGHASNDPAIRATRRSCPPGHSAATTLNSTLSRTRSPCVIMWQRRTPSRTAPSLAIAACECSLSRSVTNATRFTPNTSKAWVIRRSLHSGLTAVPH